MSALTPLLAIALLGACATDAPDAMTAETLTPAPDRAALPAAQDDEAAVAAVITELFRATDARDWATVESLFADSVHVDYSDLGAEVAVQTPAEIVAGWRAMLPGFERTIHNPHRYAVWVIPSTTEPGGPARATATYYALATHYLDDGRDDTENEWTIFAGYDSEFVEDAGRWKIARTRLHVIDQAGNPDLAQLAARRVSGAATPAESPTATPPERLAHVGEMFAALERGDVDAWLAGFSESGTQRMPLAPEGYPEVREGKRALREQYAPVADFARQRYARELYPTSDPDVVLARYTGAITVAPGETYDNSYVGVFAFDDAGLVRTFTEYFDPDILANGFPGAPPAHYSVHAAGADPASGVTLREVRFDSEGDELVGHLFLPPGFGDSPDETFPGVVVTGSWTSVKEQMPDEYASLLAEDGFATMTFDFRGFGESEGSPRGFEDYTRKIADIRSAVTALQAQPMVDAEAISGLGVCASSGYMAHATARDPRIRRLALVAPWLHDPEMTYALYDGRPNGGRDGLLALGRDAAAAFAKTGDVQYGQAVSELNPMAAMYVPDGVFDYYLDPTKAAGEHYANRWALMSWEPWLTFDAIAAADSIGVPVHVVHSERGAVPQGAKDFIARLATEPKVEWLNDYTQQDLYYVPEAVGAAMARTSAWLRGE